MNEKEMSLEKEIKKILADNPEILMIQIAHTELGFVQYTQKKDWYVVGRNFWKNKVWCGECEKLVDIGEAVSSLEDKNPVHKECFIKQLKRLVNK